MRRSGWFGTIVATLGIGALPGCHFFDLEKNSPREDDRAKLQQASVPRNSGGIAPAGPPEAKWNGPQKIDVLPPVNVQPDPPPQPPALEPPPIRHVPPLQNNVTQASPVNTQVNPTPPPDPEVVLALRRLIARQPEKAKEILSRYGSPNWESLWRLLNIADRLHEKGLDGLSAQEICTIQDSLRALNLAVLARAPLYIDKMYFSAGESKALPPGYVFRAGHRDRPGELVQVHVEFRNVGCELRNERFETTLLCSAEISDPNDKSGRPIRKFDLDEGKVTLSSAVPRTDVSTNYTFYMPNLPAGALVLTLTLQDLTRPDHPRVVRRSLEFCVNNPLERTPPAP